MSGAIPGQEVVNCIKRSQAGQAMERVLADFTRVICKEETLIEKMLP